MLVDLSEIMMAGVTYVASLNDHVFLAFKLYENNGSNVIFLFLLLPESEQVRLILN